MKIALVGKNEKLQGVLAAECVKRGMTVTQGLPSAEDLKTVDAVVDAGEGLSAEVIKENPGIRFLVVGGEETGGNVTVFNPPERFLPNGEKCGAGRGNSVFVRGRRCLYARKGQDRIRPAA